MSLLELKNISKSYISKVGNFQVFNKLNLSVDRNQNIFVVDRLNHRVQKFDSKGLFIKQWGGRGSGNGQFTGPNGIAIDNDGNIYVADTLGEMSVFFDIAPYVFVAGSLVPVGGHNPIEPAHFNCSIFFGPLMAKNQEIADEMICSKAALQIDSNGSLANFPTIVVSVSRSHNAEGMNVVAVGFDVSVSNKTIF